MRLIDAEELQHDNVDNFDSRYGDDAAKLFKDTIKYAPTVDAVLITHAHWNWDSFHCRWTCSNCGGVENDCMTPYCPWCGYVMDESV